MMALAVIACSLLLQRTAKKNHLDPNLLFDLIFWVTIAGIVGSRVFFVILNFAYFAKNPLEIIFLNQGGLAWQGGLILATLAGVGFIWHKKMPLLKTLDLVIPYAALGQALGRVGCFLNGCCQGKEWVHGIYFPVYQARLHPTQLYSAFNLLIIFFILKFFQSHNTINGRVFTWYFILASLERFCVQFLRADYAPFFLGLGIFQIINLIMILLALYGDIYLYRRSKQC